MPTASKKGRAARKAKKAKTERSAPETIKVNLKEYAAMRCAPVAKEFLKIHKIVSSVSGAGRGHLLAELKKVFG